MYKKDNFQNRLHNFFYCSKCFGIFESMSKGSRGSTNPEFMEFGGFGPSHNKTEVLLDQNEAE